MADKSIRMVRKLTTLFCLLVSPKSLESIASLPRLLEVVDLKTRYLSASTKLTLIRIIKITTSQAIKLSTWYHYDH